MPKKKNANDKLKVWMEGISNMELPKREIKPNYEQAWKDLRNKFIDEITDKDDDTLYSSDLKKVMDEMLIDYL